MIVNIIVINLLTLCSGTNSRSVCLEIENVIEDRNQDRFEFESMEMI